jgi:hypothetical protein
MLIRENPGSMQAESSKLKAKKNSSLFILSAFSFELSAKNNMGSAPDS